ncbi:hypothetical protein HDV00_000941, partial [Rhizophlyctis rosea]
METLARVSQNPGMKALLATISKTLGRRAPTLQDLLINPVQRPPRYFLLIEKLARETWPSHPDYANLNVAVTKLQRSLGKINERKGVFETVRSLEEGMAGLSIELTHPHRALLRTFLLTEHTSPSSSLSPTPTETTSKLRRVFLFTDLILCATDVYRDGVRTSGEESSFMGDTSGSVSASRSESGSSASSGEGGAGGAAGKRRPTYMFEWALPVADLVSVRTWEGRDFGVEVCWRGGGGGGSGGGVKRLAALTGEDLGVFLKMVQKAISAPPRTAIHGTGLILPEERGLKKNESRNTIKLIAGNFDKFKREGREESKVLTNLKRASRASFLLSDSSSSVLSLSSSSPPTTGRKSLKMGKVGDLGRRLSGFREEF